jgi:hypothetical protein
MKAKYGTSLQLNEEDVVLRLRLDKEKVSVIDTWRRGAEEILYEIDLLKKNVDK